MISPPFGLLFPMFFPPAHNITPRVLGLAPAPVLLLGGGRLGSVEVVSCVRLVVVVVVVVVADDVDDVVADVSFLLSLPIS